MKKDGDNGLEEEEEEGATDLKAWDGSVYLDQDSGGIQLSPTFPAQRPTLSIEAGFDQSPVLQSIREHYRDLKRSSDDLHTELYRDSRHVLTKPQKRKLWDVYSIISPSIVCVSSFYGVERKVDCSGLIIDWSSSENEATILTSAKLLWRPKDSNVEFHLIVRMSDGSLHLAREDHVDYYHNLLTLKVKSMSELEVIDFRCNGVIVEGMSVIALGRSFCSYVLCDYPGELYEGNPYFGCEELQRCTCQASKICEGGPLITNSGDVIGVNFFGNGLLAHLLPTPVILTCLEMWRSSRTVVRPWLGLSVVDADGLSFQAWTKLNISPRDSRVVVNKISPGSLADENDVRPYDTIATLNGTPIESCNQYFRLLSEASRALTVCGDLGERLTVGIDPSDRSSDAIIVVADHRRVDDMRFYDCWPKVEADEWSLKTFGSQENPSF